jgi:hypothetical protein
MHLLIDADGSPRGYLAWYNHSTQSELIRSIRPAVRNDRFGVQRMEMLAIYFAIADNITIFESQIRKSRTYRRRGKGRKITINVRSDSKSTIEQLMGLCEIRDNMLSRICERIRKLLKNISHNIVFRYIQRTNNMAGLLLERMIKTKRIWGEEI